MRRVRAAIAGHAPDEMRRRLTDLLLGERWCGHPALKLPLPPSTSPCSPAFDPACYWRGPVWPVFNWLLTWALRRDGEEVLADKLSTFAIAELEDGTYAEYYHALTGEPLGSHNQSWTAAVALDWLSPTIDFGRVTRSGALRAIRGRCRVRSRRFLVVDTIAWL